MLLDEFQTSLIFDLPIYRGSWLSLKHQLRQQIRIAKNNQICLIATPNPEQIVLAKRNRSFKSLLQQFDWLLPDGIGLVWASRWLKWRRKLNVALKERITGVDLVAWLLTEAKKYKLKTLVIGGRDYNDESLRANGQKFIFKNIAAKETKLAVSLKTDQLHLVNAKEAVVYWTSAYRNKYKPTLREEADLAAAIRLLRPSIILVALGAPEQENWLIRHKQLLETNDGLIAICSGGALDMLSGQIKRAPIWLQKLGLEWFWRLVMEPWRWRRQLKLVEFVKMVMLH